MIKWIYVDVGDKRNIAVCTKEEDGLKFRGWMDNNSVPKGQSIIKKKKEEIENV